MVDIKDFDIRLLKNYPCVNIFGQNKSGKTTLFTSLLKYYSEEKYDGFIVSQDINFMNYCNFKYSQFYFFNDVNNAMQTLKVYFKQNYNDVSKIFIYFDDCIINKELQSEICNYTFYPGVKILLASQTEPLMLSSLNATDICNFYLNFSSENHHQILYCKYDKLFINNKIYKAIFDHCTSNFHCMVITNKNNNSELYRYNIGVLRMGSYFNLINDQIKNLNKKMEILESKMDMIIKKLDS